MIGGEYMKRVMDKYTSETLDRKTVEWIKATLSNDETSTEEELLRYFMEEGSLTKDEAVLWVSRRSFYLNNIVIIET
jgi:hypothetical protein